MANLARIATYTASPLLIAAGAGAWAAITSQLKAQEMSVAPDAPFLANKPIAGPLTAAAQAEAIAKHQEGFAGGRKFADVSHEYMAAVKSGDTARAEELAGPREMLMQGNFTRASLFTSVLAYGVAALTGGLGVLLAVVGTGLSDASN